MTDPPATAAAGRRPRGRARARRRPLEPADRRGPARRAAPVRRAREAVPGIAPNILTDRLRRLERERTVAATPYQQRPPRMAYALTAEDATSRVLRLLADWGAPEGRGAPAPRVVRHGPRDPLWCPTCAVVDPTTPTSARRARSDTRRHAADGCSSVITSRCRGSSSSRMRHLALAILAASVTLSACIGARSAPATVQPTLAAVATLGFRCGEGIPDNVPSGLIEWRCQGELDDAASSMLVDGNDEGVAGITLVMDESTDPRVARRGFGLLGGRATREHGARPRRRPGRLDRRTARNRRRGRSHLGRVYHDAMHHHADVGG